MVFGCPWSLPHPPWSSGIIKATSSSRGALLMMSSIMVISSWQRSWWGQPGLPGFPDSPTLSPSRPWPFWNPHGPHGTTKAIASCSKLLLLMSCFNNFDEGRGPNGVNRGFPGIRTVQICRQVTLALCGIRLGPVEPPELFLRAANCG